LAGVVTLSGIARGDGFWDSQSGGGTRGLPSFEGSGPKVVEVAAFTEVTLVIEGVVGCGVN
jgi:hypothetical protein